MALAYLVDPENQFMTKAGTINVEGYLRVYDAATDDPAVTYCDFVGTENPEKIILDNNGRAVVIADSDRAYRLEVYNRSGTLQWTTTPLWCRATGGGVQGTELISTDGSIDIDKTTVGSLTTFDIGLAPQSDEFLEWCKCVDNSISDGDLFPTYAEGTMETVVSQGLHLGKDRFYHGTVTMRVVPTGTGINYETLSAVLKFGDDIVISRVFDVDNSLQDPVVCEFSFDYKAPDDGYLYLNLSNVSAFSDVSVEMQVHRIYSGINAVPDTCATKQWVQETFNFDLSSKIDYSAIEYNTASQITGISGSAIATTNVDPTAFVPWSASGAFQPSGNYVSADDFSSCCSAMSGAVSSLQVDVSAISSVVSSITGATGNYVEKSAISAESSVWNTVTGKQDSGNYLSSTDSGNFILTSQSGMFQPSGYYQPSGSYLSSTDSALFQPSGDYAYNSSVSSKVEQSAFDQCCSAMSAKVSALETGKLDNSASSTWYPMTGNPSGFLTEHQDLSGYVEKSAISAESAQWNEVSAKQDSSTMSAYVPFSAVESTTASAITAIGGSAIKGHEYTGISPVVVDNVNDEISVQHSSLTVDSSMTAYESAGYIVLGVNESALDLSSYQRTADMSAYQTTAGMSAYPTTSDMSSYQLTADMTAYAYNSSVVVTSTGSGKVTIAGIDRYFISSINGSAISAASSYYANSASYAGKANSADTARTAYKDVNGRDLSSIGLDSGDYVRKDAVEVAIGSANTANQSSMAQGVANSAQGQSLAQGTQNTASDNSIAQGYKNTASNDSIAQGNRNSANVNAFAQGEINTAYRDSVSQGYRNYASGSSFAQGGSNSASNFSFAQGKGNSADNSAIAFGQYNLLGDGASTGDNIAFVIGDGTNSIARHDLLNVFKDGRIVTYSSTADTTGYDFKSAISSKLDTSAFSSVSGTFLTAVPAGYATESYVDSSVSSKLDATASSLFITALPADLATTSDVASAVSGKMDLSASSSFYPMTSNPSGYLTAHQSLAGLATEEYVDSAVSGKVDTSAYDSAWFQPASAMTAYQLSGDYAYNSSLADYQPTSAMTAYQPSGDYAYTSALADYQPVSAMSAYQPSGDYADASSLSAKLDASASSSFYPADNPSGFISSVDLSNYATTAYVDSSVSGKLDTTAFNSGDFYTTDNPSGFITGIDLSPYQLTADMSGYIPTSESANYQQASAMTAYQPAGDYQPSGDYIYESALGWAEV